MGINYNELILKDTNGTIKENVNKGNVAKSKPTYEYIIEGVSGPDIVITKKTAKKEEQFVLLMSQNFLYIKNVKTGDIEKGTPENVNAFFSQLEKPLDCVDSEGNQLNWTPRFYKGMVFARVLTKLMEVEELKAFMNKGMFYQDFENWKEHHVSFTSIKSKNLKEIIWMHSILPEKYQRPYILSMSYEILHNGCECPTPRTDLDGYDDTKLNNIIAISCRPLENHPVYKKYGISGLKRYIDEFFQTAVETLPYESRLNSLLLGEPEHVLYRTTHLPQTNVVFSLDQFLHYLFYSSVEQGFANNINNFCQLWQDSLSMEYYLFDHKIQDKYPENLASYHQILSYKYSLIKQKIDDAVWADRVAKMSEYEKLDGKYIIICPKTPNDMVDESRQQSNCLSSYIRSVIEGKCMIFFLRDPEAPEKSLVTIEVRSDGTLGQVKARFNHEPTPDEKRFVEKWHYERFLKQDEE